MSTDETANSYMADTEAQHIQQDRIDFIILRVQNGDREAFMELVDRFSGMAYSTAYTILRNKEDAEDAVQEAFIRAHKYLHTLSDPRRFGGWLRSIVHQECCNLIRFWKRKKKGLDEVQTELLERLSSLFRNGPSSKAYRNEIWERSLSVLSQRAREIVLLYYMEGYTYAQIGNLLQLTEGAVKSHLHKARNKIGRRLSKLGVTSLVGMGCLVISMCNIIMPG